MTNLSGKIMSTLRYCNFYADTKSGEWGLYILDGIFQHGSQNQNGLEQLFFFPLLTGVKGKLAYRTTVVERQEQKPVKGSLGILRSTEEKVDEKLNFSPDVLI